MDKDKQQIYTVSVTHTDWWSFEQEKHGAYLLWEFALRRWRKLVVEIKQNFESEIREYGDTSVYPDEESGGLYMEEDENTGYLCIKFGHEEHQEVIQVTIDQWDILI